MAVVKYMKDRKGEIVYPRTLAEAVYLPNGESLASLLHGNTNIVFKDIVVSTTEPPDINVLWLDPNEDLNFYNKQEINALLNNLVLDSSDVKILMDDILSETSENAVKNKVLWAKFNDITERLQVIEQLLNI